MRYAFISDIHGNAVALEAVLADIKTKQVDKIIVLGDIAYRGPEPKKSIEIVQSFETDVIKGNADQWLVRGIREGEVPQQALTIMQKEQEWTRNQLNDEHINFLETLPTEWIMEEQDLKLHAFHATPDSLFDIVLPNVTNNDLLEKLTNKEEADIYLYGHIHQAYQRMIEGKTIINLGSVGLPFDGMPKASYAMVDISNGQMETSITRVSYDLEKVCQQYIDVGYPNPELVQNIIRSGRN